MREWATLSGGEGQRLALAIALGIGGAELVLLDGESRWCQPYITLFPCPLQRGIPPSL